MHSCIFILLYCVEWGIEDNNITWCYRWHISLLPLTRTEKQTKCWNVFLPDRYQSVQVHRSSRCVLNSETHFKRLIFCSSLFVIPKWILLNWTRTYKSIQRTILPSNHAPVAIDFPNQHEHHHHRITCTNRTHLILVCTAPDQTRWTMTI